jgi:hypothetical protein
MLAWFRGWRATLYIMIFQPTLYRQLRESIDAPWDEFTEVHRPE